MCKRAARRGLVLRVLLGLAVILFIATDAYSQLPRPINTARCGPINRLYGGASPMMISPTIPPPPILITGMGQTRSFTAMMLYANCPQLPPVGAYSRFVPCTMTAAGTMTRVADVAPAFLSNAMCTANLTPGGFTGTCTHTAGQPPTGRGNLRARRFCAGVPVMNPGVMLNAAQTLATTCPVANTNTGFPQGGAVVSTLCYDLMPVELMEFSITSEALPVELME